LKQQILLVIVSKSNPYPVSIEIILLWLMLWIIAYCCATTSGLTDWGEKIRANFFINFKAYHLAEHSAIYGDWVLPEDSLHYLRQMFQNLKEQEKTLIRSTDLLIPKY
jgi:hypothetical protein